MADFGTFWAGTAGARQDNIDRLHRSIDKWEDRCATLERQVAELQQRNARLEHVAAAWTEQAVYARGALDMAMNTFKEATGQTFREYLGDNEIERRKKAGREEYRRQEGLKT